MGTSFIEYLNEYRLTMASRLLISSESSILAIAEEVGYENLSYFNRTFKKRFGMTPRDYRKQSTKQLVKRVPQRIFLVLDPFFFIFPVKMVLFLCKTGPEQIFSSARPVFCKNPGPTVIFFSCGPGYLFFTRLNIPSGQFFFFSCFLFLFSYDSISKSMLPIPQSRSIVPTAPAFVTL